MAYGAAMKARNCSVSKSMEAALEEMRRDLTATRVTSAAGHDVVKIVFRYEDRYQAQKALREMISALVVEYADRRSGVELPPIVRNGVAAPTALLAKITTQLHKLSST